VTGSPGAFPVVAIADPEHGHSGFPEVRLATPAPLSSRFDEEVVGQRVSGRSGEDPWLGLPALAPRTAIHRRGRVISGADSPA